MALALVLLLGGSAQATCLEAEAETEMVCCPQSQGSALVPGVKVFRASSNNYGSTTLAITNFTEHGAIVEVTFYDNTGNIVNIGNNASFYLSAKRPEA